MRFVVLLKSRGLSFDPGWLTTFIGRCSLILAVDSRIIYINRDKRTEQMIILMMVLIIITKILIIVIMIIILIKIRLHSSIIIGAMVGVQGPDTQKYA